MCPEASTLSAYFDGELEGDAYTAVARHVGECPSCGAKLERYRVLSQGLPVLSDSDISPVAARSRGHIETRLALSGGTIWRRSLSIPAPLAAAAAAVVVLLSLGLIFTSQQPTLSHGNGVAFQGSEIEQILEYLESREMANTVTFQLPKNADLKVLNEPAFLKAAEYHQVDK